MKKVSIAICQPIIVRGGRLSVILDIVRYLNNRGIVPDIFTSEMQLDLPETLRAYSKPLHANLRLIPTPPIPAGDLHTLIFNWNLRSYADKYHLFINTSNSLEFLPERTKVLSYVFFPRRRRLMSDSPDIHIPDKKLPLLSKAGIHRTVSRLIYRYAKPTPNQTIICMTQFTKDALLVDYDCFPDLPIVYPAVDIEKYQQEGTLNSMFDRREKAVVTIGRFSPDKRQLDQILLAQKMPETPFHIIGFTASKTYFQQCKDLVDRQQIKNVHLHPSLAFSDMIRYLQKSRYFLHTLINEPFGLTAVQAVVSGTLPIVHDSGGQKETVIDDRLRYSDLAQVAEIMAKWEHKSTFEVQGVIDKLKQHVHQEFSQEGFQEKFGTIIEKLIP